MYCVKYFSSHYLGGISSKVEIFLNENKVKYIDLKVVKSTWNDGYEGEFEAILIYQEKM